MTTETSPTTRRCIGSSRFGIEAHEADAADFPVQPSQKDGLGRMCKTHWRAYVKGLREAAVARKADAATEAPEPEPEVVGMSDKTPDAEAPAPRTARRSGTKTDPTDGVGAA